MSGEGGPVLVVGGGPAGASAAAMLARRGRQVTLLERTTGPHHKICGEFLSWEGRRMLARIGAEIPQGAPIDRLRVVTPRAVRLVPLPGEAVGLSRYHLDEALLDFAATEGAELRRGVRARALVDGKLDLGGEDIPDTADIILATGKTDLRGVQRPAGGSRVTNDLTGFKLHLRLSAREGAALDRTIELHRLPSGYAGLQPIEDGKANLCLLVATEDAERWNDPLSQIERAVPALARRLAGAESLYERPLAISRVPYGLLRGPVPGALAVGDQHGVIHSFTGDGLSLALASGIGAGLLLGRAADPHRRIHDVMAPPVRRAARLYRFLNASSQFLGVAAMIPASFALMAKFTRVNSATVDAIVTESGT